MSIAYGIDILPEDDPYVVNAEKAIATVAQAAIPGRYLVDTFPFRAPSFL